MCILSHAFCLMRTRSNSTKATARNIHNASRNLRIIHFSQILNGNRTPVFHTQSQFLSALCSGFYKYQMIFRTPHCYFIQIEIFFPGEDREVQEIHRVHETRPCFPQGCISNDLLLGVRRLFSGDCLVELPASHTGDSSGFCNLSSMLS